LLSFVFARLRYRVEKPEIPATLEGRAQFWKDYYNTKEGDGKVEQYIAKARAFVPTTLFPEHMTKDY